METKMMKNEIVITKWIMKQYKKDCVTRIPNTFLTKDEIMRSTKTKNVKTNGMYFKSVMKKLGVERYETLKIIPLLAPQLCMFNSRLILPLLNKNEPNRYVFSLGFNPTACCCGKNITCEPHAVVYDTKEDKYYDFTKDFANETHKIYIPMWNDMENKITIKHILYWDRVQDWWKIGKDHSCSGIEWIVEDVSHIKDFSNGYHRRMYDLTNLSRMIIHN